jgi:glycosyltransferase involved in cell wall biosynthesis
MDKTTPTESFPLVSVCMPVYNEGNNINKSLKSIINQRYKNIQIIISDNCSTDNTLTVCENIAKEDKRIHIIKQHENVGAAKNFSDVLAHAKGKYFMWASGHDLWSENLIEECVKILEENTSTVLAYGKTDWIDNKGSKAPMASGFYDTKGLDFAAKFMMVMWNSMNPILGLIRKDAMPRLENRYNFVGSDLVLLLTLIIKGDFSCATQATFLRRLNRDPENHSKRLERYKSPETKIARSLIDKIAPLAKLPFKIIQAITTSHLGFIDKIILLSLTIPAIPVKYLVGRRSVR